MPAALIAQASVGQCVPTTAALVATAATDLTAKVAGQGKVLAGLTISPPSLTAQLEGVSKAAAGLEAAITAGADVAPPGAAVNVAAVGSILAELQASLTALLALQVTLGTAGVSVITHEGPSESHGSEVQAIVSDIAPPGNNVYSVTLLATAPAVFEALGAVILTG